MKVGSIVECINNQFPLHNKFPFIKVPKYKGIYTVRDIGVRYDGNVFIRLEELINPIMSWPDGDYGEVQFDINRFKEVDYNIAELKEILNETIPCSI